MVKVIRSARRKKTIEARLVDDELVVYLPAGMSREEEKKWIEKMELRVKKKRRGRELNADGYLVRRFDEFNRRYFGGRLEVESIKFVTNQNSRFGSCTATLGTIRISDKLARTPGWVLDYVIMHEMAHLIHQNHSRAFWEEVNKYRYTERARGFLICFGMEEDEVVK